MNTEIEDSVRTLNPSVPQKQPRAADRRGFLFKLAILINGAIGLLIATPVIRFLLGPVRPKKDYESWIALGQVSDYEPGSTILATYRNPYTNSWDGETAKVACYVRRQLDGTFTVFAVNCAHLGCPVRWFPQSQLFLCPCHGGAYYADGARAAGPPERGLFTYASRLDGDTLMIEAGQMPTLADHARLIPSRRFGFDGKRLSTGTDSQLVEGIKPCPKAQHPGMNESTIG